MLLARLAIVALISVVACGGDGYEPVWPPDECSAGNPTPFWSKTCLTRVSEICRAHATREECVAGGGASLDGDFVFYCNWVPTVTFADEATCTVASNGWRCEAHLDLFVPCYDPCEAAPGLHPAWKAVPSTGELIKMCGLPIGPWLTVGESYSYAGSCVDNTTPPKPSLCNCEQAACEVTRGMMAEPFEWRPTAN